MFDELNQMYTGNMTIVFTVSMFFLSSIEALDSDRRLHVPRSTIDGPSLSIKIVY
jgi:hypothetical protein